MDLFLPILLPNLNTHGVLLSFGRSEVNNYTIDNTLLPETTTLTVSTTTLVNHSLTEIIQNTKTTQTDYDDEDFNEKNSNEFDEYYDTIGNNASEIDYDLNVDLELKKNLKTKRSLSFNESFYRGNIII